MSIYIPPNIKVVVEGSSGETRYSQSLSDFLKKPAIQVQMTIHGSTLLDVLIEESYIAEDLVLKQVLTGNAHADATRLIGSIAESLVVNMCNEYPDVNRTLGMYARFGQRVHEKLDDYVAVATGSMRTKSCFRQYYNPSDTQRDIVWVERDNTDNQLLCISPNNNVSAKPAGLQVKASYDGVNYVLPTIQNYHYPVLYFDLNDDWGVVHKAIMSNHPGSTLIHPDQIQHEIKNILKGYFDIIISLIRGEISVQQVIQNTKYQGDSVLSAGLDVAEVTRESKLLLPSHLKKSN